MNNKAKQILIVLGAIVLSTVACTTSTNRVESSYGDALRSNVRAQLYDPSTATNPSADPVEGTDGKRMEAVMETHRGHQGSAESVSDPIVISVGN